MIKLIFILSFLVSCSRLPSSGRYIRLQKKDNLASLAKQYDLPEVVLLNANRNKNFKLGEWIFIPQKIGIATLFRDHPQFYQGRMPKAAVGGFIWPVPSTRKISSFYGKRGKRHHDGIDIPAPRGRHILAVQDGVVTYSGKKISGYGNLTIIRHRGGVFSVYAHAHKNFTKTGQKVYRGQVIATVGNTGRSTGPHLHFEIRDRGKATNPLSYIQRPSQQLLGLNK